MTTIRRQYSLPNCQLIVEGLIDSKSEDSMTSGRPLVSILVNAECAFANSEKRLIGGRDFLESLVKAASAYAQEFLSGVRHPLAHHLNANIIGFAKVEDRNLHRLIWHPETDQNNAGAPSEAVEIDLTTVQLFDLVEAVDQLLADQKTLPDLSLNLEPVSRRYRKADVPVARRVAPVALGASSVALLGALFLALPVPKVEEPPRQEETTQTEPGDGDASPAASPGLETTPPTPESPIPQESPTPQESPLEKSLSPEEVQELIAAASPIDDPTALKYLARNLYQQIDGAWEDRGTIDRDLEYRVSVTPGGTIVNYEAVQPTSQSAAEQTPLPKLRYNTLDEKAEIADFRVVFKNNEVLQVSPWDGYQGTATLGEEITDRATLSALTRPLRNRILEAQSDKPSYNEPLVFRVAVTEDGAIADYEAKNQAALDFVDSTPLPDLVKPEAAGIEPGKNLIPQEPLAQFQVIFRPSGTLEVGPLDDRYR